MVRVSVTPRGPDGGDQAGHDAGTGYVTLCYSDTSQAHPAQPRRLSIIASVARRKYTENLIVAEEDFVSKVLVLL